MADREDAPVSLESILRNDELESRPSRPANYERESQALLSLIRSLAESPGTILQTLADTILGVLECGSAGVSLLTTHDGGKRFYWPAIAGVWKPHIGGGTPRDFGPCGNVLDLNKPLLMAHVERRYKYFDPVTPKVEEALLVPFYLQEKAVGTIWAVAHDDRRKFDAEDKRQLVSLSKFASVAYGAVTSLNASTQMAAIVESSDDAIISKNLDGIITTWNGSAQRLFGYTAEEAVGQHITLIVPPGRRDEELAILEKLRRGERVDHFETVRMRKDGSMCDVSLTISPVKDARGRVIGASKVGRDITERRRSERASAEQARLLNLSTDAIFVRDGDDRISYWNQAASDLYGFSREEALGRVSHELLRTEFPTSLEKVHEQLRRDDRWTGELVHKGKDGQRIVVMSRWSLARSAGKAFCILETNNDITNEKAAEKALRDSEERFRAIVETTPECVKLVASDGTLLHMNSPGLAMVGATCAEMVVGKSIYDVIAEEDRDRFRAFNEKVCRGEKGTLEFDIVGLEGMRRHMETHGAPLRNPDGSIVQLAVTRDITGRKAAEENRKQAEVSARLLQVQDGERRRIARELHDGVGQLLTAINMNVSQSLRERSGLSPAAIQKLEEASNLVDQALAEIRTVSYLLHPPMLDEMGLESALSWYVEGFAERSKIAAKLEIPSDWPRLPQDYELCLFRIAQESLTNIHRHSGSGTALVTLLADAESITMEISDTGRGIDPEVHTKVASGESKGVGLRGMQERVKQLGGTLEISSCGRGASVRVTLPLVEGNTFPNEVSHNSVHQISIAESRAT